MINNNNKSKKKVKQPHTDPNQIKNSNSRKQHSVITFSLSFIEHRQCFFSPLHFEIFHFIRDLQIKRVRASQPGQSYCLINILSRLALLASERTHQRKRIKWTQPMRSDSSFAASFLCSCVCLWCVTSFLIYTHSYNMQKVSCFLRRFSLSLFFVGLFCHKRRQRSKLITRLLFLILKSECLSSMSSDCS